MEWFPSGNPMGILGGGIAALLPAVLGAPAWLVPPLLVLAALWAGDWVTPR